MTIPLDFVSGNVHQYSLRLRRIIVSNNLHDFVKSTDITPAIKTDHAAIELVLKDSHQSVKGPGDWKMNVSLLEDENYLNELKNNLPEWKTTGINNLSDKRSIWDWLKYLSNRPQVSMVYRLINHAGCW